MEGKNRGKLSLAAKEYRANNPDKVRDSELRKRYGLSLEEYRLLLAKQGGTCGICKTIPKRTAVVDHDHITGCVRGLLCGPCNTGLGAFKDDIARLQSGLRYLGRTLTREEWLQGIVINARSYFSSHGTPLPSNIAVSVGWCNYNPRSFAGGLYPPGGENEQTEWEIYLNPDVIGGRLAVSILLHELIHIAVAPYTGHRGPFRELSTAFGFGKILTYTTDAHSPPAWFLDHLMDGLGPYPHRRKINA